MASDLSNPQPPDEADLLAWIEGEPLPRDREQVVARALGEDRVLARKLEAMRADRAAIKGIPEMAAPTGLMSAVEAALQPVLERQMLLGLRDGESFADHPPISIVQPVKRSIMQAFFSDRVGRRLAAAAALLIMVGGATYLGTTYLSGRTAPKSSTFAGKDAGTRDPNKTSAAGAERRLASADVAKPELPAPASAAADNRESSAAALTLPKIEPAADAPSESNTSGRETVADASEYGAWAVGPFLPELDGARAAELAREGRLIIRITAMDPGVRNVGLAERVRRADGSMFRLGDEPPAALVQMLAPPTPSANSEPAREAFTPPSVAGKNEFDAPMTLVGPPAPAEWSVPAPQTVYLVQIRLDGGAMEALKSALSGGYGEVQYEELAEPLPQDGSAAVNPASVVWWTQGPSGWVGWASVPVVVDTMR
jgi:hypothetical protein